MYQAATYLLLKTPEKYQILKAKIKSVFESQSKIALIALNDLKYLNAIIIEALRLIPAGPEATRRISNGNIICGDFIPVGVCFHVHKSKVNHHCRLPRLEEKYIIGQQGITQQIGAILNHLSQNVG